MNRNVNRFFFRLWWVFGFNKCNYLASLHENVILDSVRMPSNA